MQWSQELQKNVRNVDGLLPYMKMSQEEQQRMREILAQFPMAITPYYLSLINWEDENDPIRRMAIPSVYETDLSGSFDTSGEASNTVIEGLQHKYRQTVMMLSTNQCAMYCRHCFRKRLVGLSDNEIAKHFTAMRDYIMQHTEISNVLVSGGDALMNSNERLEEILGLLADIPHLDVIRIASRIPVVLPTRITEDNELLEMLAKYNAKKQLNLVTQFNHPAELTPAARQAVQKILHLGIPVKNQVVLLRGVNDDPEVLGALLSGLTAMGVAPYYMFQCRPVSGVKNQFQVPLEDGIRIVAGAKALQSGLGKNFKYCMSHVTGKVEILGTLDNGEMVFKYHEAHDTENLGKIFTKKMRPGQAWLD